VAATATQKAAREANEKQIVAKTKSSETELVKEEEGCDTDLKLCIADGDKCVQDAKLTGPEQCCGGPEKCSCPLEGCTCVAEVDLSYPRW